MALTNNDSRILQEIVDLDGNCLDSVRCKLCPFRALCLPEFLNPTPPTKEQRAKMALDVMTHHALVDEETPLNIEEHRWDKSNHRPLPKTEARSSKVSSLYVHDEITGTLRIQNQIRQSE